MKEKKSTRPWWLERGMIITSNQEPLVFRIRAGFAGTDTIRRYWTEEHSEENVKRAKALGATLWITHCHKGFGLEAEKEEGVKAKELAEYCHKHGLKVGTYIRPDTLAYETFFAMEPRAKEWLQITEDGRIPRYGAYQYFRYRPCFNKEEYMQYMEKVVRYAIEYIKADLIHFDDLNLGPEPDSCHCQTCREKFRQYLKEKYQTAEARRERFGFANLDYVEPPAFDLFNPPWTLEVIRDPVLQEWIAFRCKYQSETYGRLSKLIRRLNPEVAVEYNATWCGISGINTAFYAGVWHPMSVVHGDIFWTEEGNWAKVTEEGALISKVRTFKVARTLKNIVFTYTSQPDPVQSKLLLAECMAYNPLCLGMIPMDKDYLVFYKENRDYFIDTESVAEAAVLRSYTSLSYNNYSTHLSTMLFEQTLIQAKVPFDIIFDEWLRKPKYKALILANVESLSDEQLDQIRGYVKAGGGLVATDETSHYDQWRRVRPSYGLADLFGLDPARTEPKGTVKNAYGEGRVVYIPRVIPSIEPERPRWSPMPRYRWIDSRYWKLPRNWGELAEAVEWASRGIPLKVDAPLTATIELLHQHQPERLLLHLINYDVRNPVSEIRVTMEVPEGKRVKALTLLSPDTKKLEGLKFMEQEGKIVFTVPRLEVYVIAAAEL